MRTFVFIFSFLITQVVFSQADIREPGDRIDMVMELLHPNTQLELRFEMNEAKVIEKKMVLVTQLPSMKIDQIALSFKDNTNIFIKSFLFINSAKISHNLFKYELIIPITSEIKTALLSKDLNSISFGLYSIPITYNTKEDNLRAFMNELNTY
ncbi:hypothetical protein [Flavobacterium sp.]|jgi:hypothetical protein|uniref:hypothetical protein n=1 Tax=Flavobacterium sp. TaxID=239 RepID=UPI0022C35AE1|nr:hypothetical protein [Flavobacterium sp.]MCZ8145196.1 hypothetical protein [Flavobacterium sp.]MCZ8367184.1 hypothetical protein [Flavobacterium sp.]